MSELEAQFEEMLDGPGGYFDPSVTPQQKRCLYQALAKHVAHLTAQAEQRGAERVKKMWLESLPEQARPLLDKAIAQALNPTDTQSRGEA